MDNNNPHIVIIVEGFANKKAIPLHHFTSQLKQRRDSIRVIYVHDKEKPMTDIQSLADSFSEQGIYDVISNADIETRLPNVIDFPLSDGNVDLPTNNDNYTYIPPSKTNKVKPYRKKRKFIITALLHKYDIPISMVVMVGIVLALIVFVFFFSRCSGKNIDYSSADNSSELKLVEEITQTEPVVTSKEIITTTITKAEVVETVEESTESQNAPQTETNKAEVTPSKPNNQTTTQAPTQATTQAPTTTPLPTITPTPSTQAPETIPPIQVKVNGIKLSTSASDNNVILNIGSQSKITPVISPTNATNGTVTWTSNKPSIASVDSTGTVTATGSGKAIITATTVDGGLSASCMITVN